MSSLPVGTAVKLQGLSNADYNGKKGIIAVTAKELADRGRVAVIATAQHCEGAKGNMILVAQRLTGVALA